ncbi:MAG: SpaH/EbpB family LPXTG-anchored major pilin [Peptoniphilus grossensis]|uniref:SpaH/EbpB family LPXTG-anchored major pilin n=1 Tax=Peptoniphilus grossensis TaxID=1465756 RepID=UPI0029121F29|nr:SpaH/EbpB family LPXTG-anchored major pilin [Peptoniphilus grossensis]MDU7150995.1 SpaH/EbpB family LPXTG-anchored major pilin [Peptoniphilus grossensis]
MNKKKILSLIMALVMIVGVFSPLTAFADQTVPTTNLNIHKIKLDNFDEVTAKDHKGQELSLDDLKGENYFKGKNPEWLNGVKFTYYKVTTEQLAKIEETNPQTKEQVQAIIDQNAALFDGVAGVETEATSGNGLVTIPNLAEGTYYFVESETPANHTGALAVPFKITLPIYDDNGAAMKDVHIYPKNKLTDKTTTKDLDTEANKANKKTETHNVTVKDDKGNRILTLDKGAKVPYVVTTPIPAGSKEIILAWSDRMSPGLTYNNDLVVSATYGDPGTDLALEAADYTITNSDNGFVLKFTDAGIKKVLEKTLNKGDGVKLIDGNTIYNKQADEAAQKVEITLKYSATLNGLTGPVDPETNTVSFFYGNKPGYTPQPGDKNPIPETNKTEIPVSKSFVGGDGATAKDWPKDLSVTVKLQKWDPATNKWEDVAGKTLTLNDAQTSGKFDGLNEKEKYRVVEVEINGWVANYSHDAQGGVVIKNKENPNPNPITPPEVTVTSGGIRFVKTDDNNANPLRLIGGKFIISNQDGKYLYYKTEAQLTDEQTALKTAEGQLKALVDEYNAMTAEQQNGAEGTAKKTAIDEKATEIAGLKKKASIQYTWKEGFGTKDNLTENLVVLTPNSQGYMEITGLDFATYNLVEIEAPKGYAIPADGQKFEFTVDKDSYSNLNLTGENAMIDSTTTDTTKAQRLVNKKVTIPQTGGMGTVIFTVVGIGLMAGAVMAMKKNREEA